jgi:hypothetical protein
MSSEAYQLTRRHIAQNRNTNSIRENSKVKIQLYFVPQNVILFVAENLKCFLVFV